MRKTDRSVNTMFGTYQSDKEEVKRTWKIVVVMALCAIGFVIVMSSAQNFWMSLKPEYDVEYLLDNGAREGMHVKGAVPYTYGCFADMSNMDGGKVSAYYYTIPAEEGMMILEIPADRQAAMETLLEETLDYLDTGVWPVSTIMLEGYVVKAQGRLPYLLSEYMREIGYTDAEIAAMGEPLMIKDASRRMQRARISAPVGMILLTAGILLGVFFLFRSRRKR